MFPLTTAYDKLSGINHAGDTHGHRKDMVFPLESEGFMYSMALLQEDAFRDLSTVTPWSFFLCR